MNIYEPTASGLAEDLRELRVRLLVSLVFLVVVTVVGTLGFHGFDPAAGWIRALFMTVITLTTVGYGHEVALDSDAALLFTSALILAGMGGVLYFVSTATAFILEGRLGHVYRRRKMESELSSLSGHLIVCGSGPEAEYTAQELASVRRKVVLVTESREAAERLAQGLPSVLFVVGDPAEDATLRTAGVERAGGLVACTGSDRENLVVSLSARQLNETLRIVAGVQHVEGASKLRRVGADAVVSPEFIGGLRLASELLRPTVVTFLDTMLRDRDANLRIDEVRIPEGSPSVGRTLGDLDWSARSRALLLAVRGRDGTWEYNPPGGRAVASEDVLVFLGSPDDALAVCDTVSGAMVARPTP